MKPFVRAYDMFHKLFSTYFHKHFRIVYENSLYENSLILFYHKPLLATRTEAGI